MTDDQTPPPEPPVPPSASGMQQVDPPRQPFPRATVTPLVPEHLGASRSNATRRRARREAEEALRQAGTTAVETSQKVNLSPALLDPEVMRKQMQIIGIAQNLAIDLLADEDIPKLDRLKVAAQFIPKMSAEITGRLVEAQLEAMRKQAPARRSPATSALLKQSKDLLAETPSENPEDTAS